MFNINKMNLSGMQTFTVIWFGQFLSIAGTAMTIALEQKYHAT